MNCDFADIRHISSLNEPPAKRIHYSGSGKDYVNSVVAPGKYIMQIGTSVLTHQAHGIITVTLNRADTVNAIDETMLTELHDVFHDIRANDDIRAVVLTGAGDHFSVGGDITNLQDMTEKAAMHYMHDVRDTVIAVAACDKPVIAAIEGHSASGGIGLALLCDHIIASKTARFTFSYARIGLGPDWGLSITLRERVGRHVARKLLFEATKLDAMSAQQSGLIDDLCLKGTAEEVAWQYALKLSNKPTSAMQSIKCQYRIPIPDLGHALENEALSQTACIMCEDFHKGLDAFRNRRRPEFSR